MLRFFGIASLAIAVLALLFGFAALSLAQSMGAQGAGGSSAGAPIAEPGGGAAIITKLLKTPSGGAAAYTEQVLYDFCSQSNCADGAYPSASLIMDGAGNLYGTTRSGGNSGCGPNCGTVFELVPSGSGWTETVLYNFCSQSNCADGANPSANLIMDGAGNLYSTTSSGGSHGGGTVFQLAPNGSGWTETVLYNFCSQNSCTDGKSPVAGLIIDGAGNLYGTTYSGGNGGGGSAGTVFELVPSGSGSTERVLYGFCPAGGACADGATPVAGLIMDGAGNLYSTTSSGGSHGGGTVFELASSGTGWTETVLHIFAGYPADGASPLAGLIMDGAGNFYGTTGFGGGSINKCSTTALSGCGTVFKLVPSRIGWTEDVLYNFCSRSNCTDGSVPFAGLITDGAGNLYGTTSGLSNGKGTVFELIAQSTPYTLAVSELGPGTVTSSPAGISCGNGGACSASFTQGTTVTLSETPAGGWNFLEWDEACTGVGACDVTMTANENVMATFWQDASSH